jgi:glutamate carboxypeptidase
MKGGLIVALAAIEALEACHLGHLESITFMLIPDEELGSVHSRTIIEAEARKADWALVMEPGRPNGGVVTSRGVVGALYLRARGRTAHCGDNFSEGVSAIRELAQKVGPIEALSVPEEDRILNIGIFRGGEARQVVPADAAIHIDLRAPNDEEANQLIGRLQEIALTSTNPQVELSLSGGLTRPAFRRTAGVFDLYRRALAIAQEIKIPLPEIHSRAGSDANLVAGQGTPALDGLGPVAWDVCSRRERISLESLGQRALLLANLMAGLESEF